ncbi:MAG: NF038122 family metalloprotease, partial [Planctomycetes bacterium]|nr:NF038122 family metalloprotease [Planctomycetota bacterium]
MIRGFVGVCVAIGVMAMSGSRASAQLTFNITNQGGATPEMIAGFQKAAALWSGVFNDPITINIRVNAAALKIGQIGATSSFFDPYSYTDVRNALMNDRISGNDISSTNALQSGSSFSMLINRTANNPNGVVSATPYFDTGIGGPGQAGAENNSTVRLTTANAKAMGLIAGNSPLLDGTITFTTLQAYDF